MHTLEHVCAGWGGLPARGCDERSRRFRRGRRPHGGRAVYVPGATVGDYWLMVGAPVLLPCAWTRRWLLSWGGKCAATPVLRRVPAGVRERPRVLGAQARRCRCLRCTRRPQGGVPAA